MLGDDGGDGFDVGTAVLAGFERGGFVGELESGQGRGGGARDE